ncbi:MAG TPA: hypothetical protein VFG54_04635 [Prolixibacteraceae bacterium]|nr:hypothetical protein [Prolixibacteraceae bacterium]
MSFFVCGDTLIDGKEKPNTRQLMDVYERYQGSVIALEQVPWEKGSRYGIINGKSMG